MSAQSLPFLAEAWVVRPSTWPKQFQPIIWVKMNPCGASAEQDRRRRNASARQRPSRKESRFVLFSFLKALFACMGQKWRSLKPMEVKRDLGRVNSRLPPGLPGTCLHLCSHLACPLYKFYQEKKLGFFFLKKNSVSLWRIDPPRTV